jgi:hypothetical protein
VIDSAGWPKSVWYALKRASRDVAIALTNEGLNGAHVHAWNDSTSPVQGRIIVRLLQNGAEEVLMNSRALTVPPRSAVTLSCEAILGRFADVAQAYRFGAPGHDVIHAAWVAGPEALETPTLARGHAALVTRFAGRPVIDEAVLLPGGGARPIFDTGLRVSGLHRIDDDNVALTLACDRITPFVRVGSTR